MRSDFAVVRSRQGTQKAGDLGDVSGVPMGSRTDAVKFRTQPCDPGRVPRQPKVVSSGLDYTGREGSLYG